MTDIKYYFTYNSIKSKDCMLKLKSRPDKTIISRKNTAIDFKNIDGSLYKIEDTFKTFQISIDCMLIEENATLENINLIKKMLSNPEAILSFSWEENILYKARFLENVNISEENIQTLVFKIIFECSPYKLLRTGIDFIKMENDVITLNAGQDVEVSTPIYKIEVTDVANVNITIKKDSNITIISNVNKTLGEIYVNTDLLQVYNKNMDNLNNLVSLDYNLEDLYLNNGDNIIEITGGTFLTKEVKPNWRVL